jgi:hypothetical protein
MRFLLAYFLRSQRVFITLILLGWCFYIPWVLSEIGGWWSLLGIL